MQADREVEQIQQMFYMDEDQTLLLLYNILLSINCYIGNSTTECHSGSHE